MLRLIVIWFNFILDDLGLGHVVLSEVAVLACALLVVLPVWGRGALGQSRLALRGVAS